jgi:hypothetical protein
LFTSPLWPVSVLTFALDFFLLGFDDVRFLFSNFQDQGEVIMPDVTKPTSVRECLKAIGSGSVAGASASQVEQCAKIGAFMDRRPILGGLLQSLLLHKYEHDTGKVGAIDWEAFLTWLTTNMPAILQMIMSILAMFGV